MAMIYNQRYCSFCTVILLSVIACEIKTSELPRPRGVSVANAPLYTPGDTFVCLDGTFKVPYTYVNDEYCDCADGSDEPGTSACPSAWFHCTNAGHQSLNIPSSRVNDGICDCCDGSDEYGKPESRCYNSCFELGNSARIEAQRKLELLKAGSVKRKELIQLAQQRKQQRVERVETLRTNLVELEDLKLELEQLKNITEGLENKALEQYRQIDEEEKRKRDEEELQADRNQAAEKFMGFDSNQDGKIDVAEIQAQRMFDTDKNGEVTEQEAKYFLDDQVELQLEDFITKAWPRIKPYVLAESGLYEPPVATETEPVEGGHEAEQQEEPVEEFEDEGDEEAEADGSDVEEVDTDDENKEKEAAPERIYDDYTQKLINDSNAARTAFYGADRAVKTMQSEIATLEKTLEQDYGPDDEFLSMHNACYEHSDREYVYRLCPFENATQQPKNGGSETRLGMWSGWTGSTNNKYQEMYYDKGASCWNGPQRSTRVHIFCGIDEKITSVSEPNRCEYEFDFQTPAVCYDAVESQPQDEHDEL